MADTDCCKYLMFIFNLLIFLGGAGLLGVGIWVVVGADSFREIISSNPQIFSAAYIIIAVGALLLVVGFLGCCGAIKENKCLLGTFFVMVLLLFIIEIVGGILAFVFYPDAKQLALDTMRQYGGDSAADQSITASWDALHEAFDCCGLNGPQDWAAALVIPPPSSCGTNTEGCEAAVQNYFWVLGGIAVGVLFIELLAMIFACCLYRNVKKERYA